MTCFSLRLTLLLAAMLVPVSGGSAPAQTVCGEREAIVAELERNYGETRRSIGLQTGRGVVEVYASDKTGSWTIVVTDVRGKSCLMAAGEAFETLKSAGSETSA